MKIKALVFLFLVSCIFQGCQSSSSKNTSYIHSIIDSLPIDKTKNIIIYTINPNDCINCLNGFKFINADFSKTAHPIVYIIAVERIIERIALAESIKQINFAASTSNHVIWDKTIYSEVNRSFNKDLPLSFVCIYNYEKDSIIYSKAIREMNDEKEFKMGLEKTF
jgi:hypothetical protein